MSEENETNALATEGQLTDMNKLRERLLAPTEDAPEYTTLINPYTIEVWYRGTKLCATYSVEDILYFGRACEVGPSEDGELEFYLLDLIRDVRRRGETLEIPGDFYPMAYEEYYEHGYWQGALYFHVWTDEGLVSSTTLIPADMPVYVEDAKKTCWSQMIDTANIYEFRHSREPVYDGPEEVHWAKMNEDPEYRWRVIADSMTRCPDCRGESVLSKRMACKTCQRGGFVQVSNMWVPRIDAKTRAVMYRSLLYGTQATPLYPEYDAGYATDEALVRYLMWYDTHLEEHGHALRALHDVVVSEESNATLAARLGYNWTQMSTRARQELFGLMKKHRIGAFLDERGDNLGEDDEYVALLKGPLGILDGAYDELMEIWGDFIFGRDVEYEQDADEDALWAEE